MSISLPGMIGAMIGFALAWVDWKAVSGILRHKHQQKAFAMTGAEERRRADARLKVLLKVVDRKSTRPELDHRVSHGGANRGMTRSAYSTTQGAFAR